MTKTSKSGLAVLDQDCRVVVSVIPDRNVMSLEDAHALWGFMEANAKTSDKGTYVAYCDADFSQKDRLLLFIDKPLNSDW